MKKKTLPFKVFVIEDDPMFQRMVKYIMELNPDHEVHVFATGEECIQNLHLNPNIISLDYTLPDITGAEVLKQIKHYNNNIAVVILSSQQDVSTAVQLLREGAYDYITKDGETKERLLNAITNIKEQQSLLSELDTLKSELETNYSFSKTIVGQSKAMQQIFSLLKKTVNTNITVSISGETGTGKEVIAKAIHYNSVRNNCTTNLVDHVNNLRANRVAFGWRILLPGFSAEYAYDLGLLDNSIPFEDLQTIAYVSDLAERYHDSPDFSQQIRSRRRNIARIAAGQRARFQTLNSSGQEFLDQRVADQQATRLR